MSAESADETPSRLTVWDEIEDMDLDQAERTLREIAAKQWRITVERYRRDPADFYNAWQYVHDHPIMTDDLGCSRMDLTVDVNVVKVNPDTDEIDDDPERNTKVEIWIESGPLWRKDDAPDGWWDEGCDYASTGDVLRTHDYELDTGGATYEEAIISLAALIRQHFGDDRQHVYQSKEQPTETPGERIC